MSLILIPITVLLLIGTLVVLAIWRNGDYLYSPSPDIQLQADDELIVFAPSQQRDIFGQATQ